MDQIALKRDQIFHIEYSMYALYEAFISFIGGKPMSPKEMREHAERQEALPLEAKTSFPVAKISKKEMDAFIDAGMPSPFDKWLANYRKAQ
jgi:hypothetical protein